MLLSVLLEDGLVEMLHRKVMDEFLMLYIFHTVIILCAFNANCICICVVSIKYIQHD